MNLLPLDHYNSNNIMIFPSHLLTILLLLVISRSKVLEQREGYIKFLLEKNTQIFPFYEVQIYLGDPKQPQTFIIDTGSFDFLVKVSACITCQDVSARPLFRPADSSTFQPINCKKDLQICDQYCNQRQNQDFKCYMQQSFGSDLARLQFTIQLVREIVSFTQNPAEDSTSTKIGAIQKIISDRALKPIVTNGLLGLSAFNRRSFVYDWFSANHVPPSNMNLGLCFDESIGIMQWGSIEQKRSDPINISFNQNFQTEEITQYQFDGVNLMGKNKKIISTIDSGSRFLLLPFESFSKITQIISNQCLNQPEICLEYNAEQSEENSKDISSFKYKCYIFDTQNYFGQIPLLVDSVFSQISIKLSGKSIVIKPSNYFQQVDAQNDVGQAKAACLAIVPSKDLYVLGLPFFKDRKIIYNYDSFELKLYDEYNCMQRKVGSEQAISYYLAFVGVFVFVFFRNYIVNLVRKCCRRMEEAEQDETQSQSKIQNEEKANQEA